MKLTSIAAIYLLFWVMSAFFVMPFHVRTADDIGEEVAPGHADSAPVGLRPKRLLLWITGVATLLFGLYYANYVNGWISPELFQIAR